MEFFEETNRTHIDSVELKTLLSISNLPKLCNSIDKVITDNITNGTIFCLWGEFNINREELNDGVRFTMPGCPNAFTWTITTAEDDMLHIHCTIKQRTHEPDFIASIEDFTHDWKAGLNLALESNTQLKSAN